MFALLASKPAPLQWRALSGYSTAFGLRGLHVKLVSPHPGYLQHEGVWVKFETAFIDAPYLVPQDIPGIDMGRHCCWAWDDVVDVPAFARNCQWVLHHGPARDLLEQSTRRILLLPKEDLFRIRHGPDTPYDLGRYRSLIAVPWEQRRDELYFVGAFTGAPDVHNSRLQAVLQLNRTELPRHVGFIPSPQQIPAMFQDILPMVQPEPLETIAQYKFLLSLWGNHPFNPRLCRGMEAGCLVFHQATPQVRMLHDDLFRPNEDYVEIRPDLGNLVDKVAYYMDHPSEAREVAEHGHTTWMSKVYCEAPFALSETVWNSVISQPGWEEFRSVFDVHG